MYEVVHTLNAVAIERWDGVVCHAGGVARDGVGIVLPADMESGKSTLTAGLVRAGFDYLSDEGIAFHPDTNLIQPYPKPLSLDPGSWFLFPELEPRADLGDDDYKQNQWQVAPDAIREGAVADPCPAGVLVFPQYVEGSTTELVPIGRAEALIELAKNTFSFNQQSRFALEQLAGIVRVVPSYRLTVGSLAAAVATIEQLVSSMSRTREPMPDQIDEHVAPARGSEVFTVELDGEAVLLDEAADRLHLLNHTGHPALAALRRLHVARGARRRARHRARPRPRADARRPRGDHRAPGRRRTAGVTDRRRGTTASPHVLWRCTLDTVVLLPVSSDDEPFVLSGSGPELWELLADPRTLDDLVAVLAAVHAVDPATVRADVEPMLEQLAARRAIELL